MGEQQKTQIREQKQVKRLEKLAHRTKPQHAQPAQALVDLESNAGLDKDLNDGMNKNLIDGEYEKTVHVKTLSVKTITIKDDPLNTVDSAKEQIEKKKNPERTATPCVSRKSPEENED